MSRTLRALLTDSGAVIPGTVLCENCFTTPGERQFSAEIARRSGNWNGSGFTDCAHAEIECSACGYLTADPDLADHEESPRGFTYRAENYCPAHIIEACLHTGLASPAGRDMEPMEALAQIAEALAIDFGDHVSYDSDDFPKPFGRYFTEPSACGTCSAVI